MEDNYPRVHEFLKKKGELFKHMSAANIHLEERSSLDAHFIDENLPQVMGQMFPGLSHNDYTKSMIEICCHSGELPLCFDE